MNDHNNIRRALANEGLELPADQPVPSRLIGDIYAHTEIEGAMPLSDPESEAIAAHTTPGKGEPTSIDIEAAIAEQAMRRLATRLATEWACDTVSIRIANGTTYAWVSAWVGTALCEENGSTLTEAMTKCKEKLTASRCTCPACGRAGV